MRLGSSLGEDLPGSDDIHRDRLLTHDMLAVVSSKRPGPLLIHCWRQAYQAQIKTLDNQGRMSGSRGGNEDSLGTAILHAILWIREKLNGGWKVGRSPLVATWLGVTGRDELDARLLKSEDTGTDGTKAAETD